MAADRVGAVPAVPVVPDVSGMSGVLGVPVVSDVSGMSGVMAVPVVPGEPAGAARVCGAGASRQVWGAGARTRTENFLND